MATMSVEANVLTLGVTMGAAETLVVRLVALVAVLLSPSCMGRLWMYGIGCYIIMSLNTINLWSCLYDDVLRAPTCG